MIYVYPENWVEPAPPLKIVLSDAQRLAVKNKMKEYINLKDKPILIKDLAEVAQKFILKNYNVHIQDQVLAEIAIEIQNEWHPVIIEKEVLDI